MDHWILYHCALQLACSCLHHNKIQLLSSTVVHFLSEYLHHHLNNMAAFFISISPTPSPPCSLGF
ncbi:uncharacterized protein DS421_17g576690 [Arachis hypogaea]|nr:uncharacterized protein DS421_17g576690 [Arachis hypogaea]